MKNTLLALLLVAAGCGDEKKAASVNPSVLPAASAAEEKPVPAAKVASEKVGDGSITGTVRIKGELPRQTKIPMDPQCLALHGGTPPKSEEVVADSEKRVKWAMVSVKSGLEGKTFAAPKEPLLIDQQGCMYTPHVFGVMAGQEIRIRNSDGFLHNIHGLPFSNKEFNMAQQGGQENTIVWRQQESGVKVKCDIHAWMKAWGHVFDHPFFCVTDDAGSFAIKGLPAGKYTIEVWHEIYKSVKKDVEVKAGDAKVVDVELAERKGQ